ncbi:MAG TPA: ferredoxin [Rugosimonospora sp.]|nr:ferredoxin [Rugosimonospora sp.]
MKVVVDDERCRGHAVCCAICPDVFALGADGYAVVRQPEVPPEFEDAVRDAGDSCPERAIVTT